MSGTRAQALVAAASMVLAGAADAQSFTPSATVVPRTAQLGERVTYRARAVVPGGVKVQWLPPETADDLAWGRPTARRIGGRTVERVGEARRQPARTYTGVDPDTIEVAIPLQAFRTGVVRIPGLRFFEYRGGVGDTAVRRAPAFDLVVTPMLTPADSNADLRPPRGPLAAPWWERVPWRWVVLGALILAAIVFLVRRLRRRRPVPVVTAPVAVVPRIDPYERALSDLAALRRLGLPAQGRFAEHAFQLSHIARRFLEAVSGRSRPSDTTPELLARFEDEAAQGDALSELGRLLRFWDLVKFARAAASVDEAARAEEAVERMVRQWRTPSDRAA